MGHEFGERGRFAIEVGRALRGGPEDGIRVVRLWAAGRELSCDDHHVFVPQFYRALEADIPSDIPYSSRDLPYPDSSPEENHQCVRASGYEAHSRYRFMFWGPTTDNLISYRFTRASNSILTFEFWRDTHVLAEEIGRVFVSELPTQELSSILRQGSHVLRRGE